MSERLCGSASLDFAGANFVAPGSLGSNPVQLKPSNMNQTTFLVVNSCPKWQLSFLDCPLVLAGVDLGPFI